jgi:hypothetical protein
VNLFRISCSHAQQQCILYGKGRLPNTTTCLRQIRRFEEHFSTRRQLAQSQLARAKVNIVPEMFGRSAESFREQGCPGYFNSQ